MSKSKSTKTRTKKAPSEPKAKRGRPAIHAPDMTKQHMIRTTPADFARWQTLAAKRGLNVSALLRMLGNRECDKAESV